MAEYLTWAYGLDSQWIHCKQFRESCYHIRPIVSHIRSIERRHFQRPGTTPTPDFKVMPLFNAEYLRNATRYRHSFNRILIATYTRLTEGCHFESSWVTYNIEIFNDTASRGFSLSRGNKLLLHCIVLFQVAMVVDRVLLLVFTTTTLGITAAILLHAPLSREFLFGGDFTVDLAGSIGATDNQTSSNSSMWTCRHVSSGIYLRNTFSLQQQQQQLLLLLLLQ